METVHGYADGQRVRDTRDGMLGTVRHLIWSAAVPGLAAVGAPYAAAEVCWDRRYTADELDLVLDVIEPITHQGSVVSRPPDRGLLSS